jgi:hypothetical protein
VDQQTPAVSFISLRLVTVLKLLHHGKRVLLCMQSKTTASNAGSLKAAQRAAADDRAKGQMQTRQVGPADVRSTGLTAPLKLPASFEEATAHIPVPPGAQALTCEMVAGLSASGSFRLAAQRAAQALRTYHTRWRHHRWNDHLPAGYHSWTVI